MPRTPIDVYRGLTQTRIGDDIKSTINGFVMPFSEHIFADEQLSTHLSRFIGLISRLTAYLDSRYVVGRDDLTIAIDLLDQVTSTTKWWVLERRNPGLTLRPRVRDPREFMISTRNIEFSGATQSRIKGALDKLLRFLEEQNIGNTSERQNLLELLGSSWSLLSAFLSRNEGRVLTNEEDFERSYDVIRILLFYTTLEDFHALVASRGLATNPTLIKTARVSFSPGFERSIESSVAAHLEKQHEALLTRVVISKPSASRNILTNSLRFLAQLQSIEREQDRVEESDYEEFTRVSIKQLEGIGISPDSLDNEISVVKLFKKLKPEEGLNERLDLLSRRIESFLIDASGNRDFLLQNARFIPRLLSILLLIAAGTKTTSDELSDSDIKRGLILLRDLVSG
ncbi:MAG: hypothetical protein ACFFEJ_06935 [Candidatus Thorarchaeota archaeon]